MARTIRVGFVPITSSHGDPPDVDPIQLGMEFGSTLNRGYPHYFRLISYGEIELDVTYVTKWVDGGDAEFTQDFLNIAARRMPHVDMVVAVTPWHHINTFNPPPGTRQFRPAGANSRFEVDGKAYMGAMSIIAQDGPLHLATGNHDRFAWWVYHEMAHAILDLAHAGHVICEDLDGNHIPWAPPEMRSRYDLRTPGHQPGGITMGTGRHLNAVQADWNGLIETDAVLTSGEHRFTIEPMGRMGADGIKAVKVPLIVDDRGDVQQWMWIENRDPVGLDAELPPYWNEGLVCYTRGIIPGHTQDPAKVSSIMLDMDPGTAISLEDWRTLPPEEKRDLDPRRLPWGEQRHSALLPSRIWINPGNGIEIWCPQDGEVIVDVPEGVLPAPEPKEPDVDVGAARIVLQDAKDRIDAAIDHLGGTS